MRAQHYHLRLPFWHVDMDKDIRLLYFIRFIHDLIAKAALMYVPLYIYQLSSFPISIPGIDIEHLSGKIFWISIYYLSMRFFALTTIIPFSKIVKKIGLKYSILASSFVMGAYLLLLPFIAQSGPMFFLVAFLWSVEINLFWTSFHTSMAKAALKDHMGQDLGAMMFFVQLASAVAPAAGGLIISLAGYSAVFSFGVIGVMMTALVVMFMEDKSLEKLPSWKEFRTWMKEQRFRRLAVSFAGKYMNDAAIALWPLYVFLLLGSIEKVGYLYSFTLLLSMIIVFVSGTYLDYSKNKKPFWTSGGLLALVWLARTQVFTIWNVAIVDTINKLTASFHWLYYETIYTRRAQGKSVFSFFVYREIILSLTAIVFWSVLAVAFGFFRMDWVGLFVIGSVGVMLSLLVNERRDESQK